MASTAAKVSFCFQESDESFVKSLFRLSDEGGKLQFSLVSEGSISRSSLDSKDVFIIDTGKSLFVWVGKGASDGEKKNAMTYAHVSCYHFHDSYDYTESCLSIYMKTLLKNL